MPSVKEALFTAGQFAKLHSINKRTLLYYDDIGLFSPAVKKPNGYRYYTLAQSPSLEMILTLRELNMSIPEIKQFQQNRCAGALAALLQSKTRQIDATLHHLRKLRRLLLLKQEAILAQQNAVFDLIQPIQCAPEHLLLSGPISGASEEEEFAVLAEHTQNHSYRLFNHQFGICIAADELYEGRYSSYCCYFTKVERPSRRAGLFLKPGGSYLCVYHQGGWDTLPQVYQSLVAYARENRLSLQGFAYETGVNDLAVNSIEEYVTQITIRYRPA